MRLDARRKGITFSYPSEANYVTQGEERASRHLVSGARHITLAAFSIVAWEMVESRYELKSLKKPKFLQNQTRL